MSVTVFVHVYPKLNDDYSHASASGSGYPARVITIMPDLGVSIHRVKETADAAYEKIGGLVLQTTAEQLKGQISGLAYMSGPDDHLSDFVEPGIEAPECFNDFRADIVLSKQGVEIEEGSWQIDPEDDTWVVDVCKTASIEAEIC